MRLLIAKVSHETNTFSPVPTPVERFCPDGRRYVAIKSRVHWRADLGGMARHVVECDGMGVCTSDYGILNFVHVQRPVFPLDRINTRA